MNTCSYWSMKVHVPGTGIHILCSHEFFSEVEMIMLFSKNQKPGKMVQLGKWLPCKHEDPSSMSSIWAYPGVPVISVLERQRQEDSWLAGQPVEQHEQAPG